MFDHLSQYFITNNTILTAALAFLLGMWVYFDRRRDPRNITLGGLLVVVSLWSFALVLWRMSDDERQARFWLSSLFFIGSCLPVLYLFFAHSFLFDRQPRLIIQFALLLPSLFLFVIAYGTDLLLRGGAGSQVIFGPGRLVFALHFAVYTILALLLFLAASRRDRLIDRAKIISVLVGTILAFDVIFSVLYGSQLTARPEYFWIGNAALLLGMFIIAVSVLRNKFIVDLRLVSVEVFILVVLFVIVADIVVAQTLLDFTLRLVILIVLIFYGVITSRNMVHEVRHMREIEAMNEHITKMNGRLLEADRSKTRFVSLASHQFRSPLGGIRSYLDMLIAGDFGPLTQKQKEVLALNLGVCGQLLETIETFLGASKIELGSLELYKADTKLCELVSRVVAAIKPLADKKQLSIDTDIPATLLPVCCDAGKIYHVLMNLLDNAIKYTPGGRIEIRAALSGKYVEVRVKDTGAGLDPAEIGKLFETFKRGLAGVTLNKDGSGLGLFLVKNIVEAHGGHVIVESPGRGRGSTFGFTLPLADFHPSVVAPLLTQK